MSTVNDAYEAYRSDPTDENYARLYEALREYSQSLAKSVIPDVGRTSHHHAAENAATNSLLELEKFVPQKASFSTWAYMSIQRDLIDWARKRERRRENSLEDSLTEVESNTSKSTEAISAIEARLFLQKFLSSLSHEERTLCELMQNGSSLHRMADALGVSLATVKRRWDGIAESGLKLHSSADPRCSKVSMVSGNLPAKFVALTSEMKVSPSFRGTWLKKTTSPVESIKSTPHRYPLEEHTHSFRIKEISQQNLHVGVD